MPNRIIKETICTSEDLNELSPYAEILFYRLMVKADDFGAYYGNDSIVKSTCFPLRSDEIKSAQVESWLGELAKAGLIILYEAQDGRRYLQFSKWDKHQQIRAKKRKFPPFDDTCKQLIADDCKCPRNPIQSNPIHSESNAETVGKPTSHAYGVYGWVKLTDEQYQKLLDDLGKDELSRCITYIDESAQSSHNKNKWKDWNLVVRRCSREQWGKRGGNNGQSVHGDAQKSTKQFPNVHYDNL